MITIIVEDGTGVPDANAYIDEAFAEQYFTLQGSTLWDDNCDSQALALVQASAFFDLRYSARFCGQLVEADQGLLFPRKIAGHNTGIPKTLKNAVAALALQFMEGGMTLDLNANADNAVRSTTVSVGSGAVSESVTYYDKPSTKVAFSNFAITDRYLDQLMKSLGCEGATGSIMFIPAWRS